MVLAFGLSASRLISNPTTWSRLICAEARVRCLPQTKKPSLSKNALSLESSRICEFGFAVKPIRNNDRGSVGRPLNRCELSIGLRLSTILASNKYLPALTPTLQRMPASKYCKPASLSVISTFPSAVGIALQVEWAVLQHTPALSTFFRLSSGASVSSCIFSGSFTSSGSPVSSLTWSPSSFGSILASSLDSSLTSASSFFASTSSGFASASLAMCLATHAS
mmetsp:Transcript_62109/g.96490  ORF Transcript_62109/g.96490 Transcript_62109/m.96490 type:complete len:222 (-) Transcript_62109:22-687(-)